MTLESLYDVKEKINNEVFELINCSSEHRDVFINVSDLCMF